MRTRYRQLRRSVGVLLLLILIGLPFLRINGESAFRFDIPTLRLLFFGARIGMADSFIILIALIFITFFILFVTTLFGRVWCGWLCPQTVLSDLTRFMETARSRRPAARTLAALVTVVPSCVVAASLIGYFVPPWAVPGMIRAGGTPAGIVTWSWLVLSALLYLDLSLLRRNFCATVCPYAKLQGVLFDDRTLLIAFDRQRQDECMDCRACVRVCPVGIDIRRGTQAACIHCAECVDVCSDRMAGRGKYSLISYSFGSGMHVSRFRITPLIMGLMTALSLLFLLWLSLTRMPFDVNVRLAYTDGPRQNADGSVTNVYELSFRNLVDKELEIVLAAGSPQHAAGISPERIVLRPGQDIVRIPAAVTLRNVPASAPVPDLQFSFRSSSPDKTVSRSIYFILPRDR